MKLVIAASTDIGTSRETNEDFFYYSKPSQLIVVCDGLGGHQSGAVASRIAGKTVRDIFFHADFAELARLGEDVIDQLPPLALRLVVGARLANRRLLLMAERDRKLRGMGTTLVAIAFSKSSAYVAHIGDSRLYCWRGNQLTQITEDHSLVNQLLQDRDIRQDQVKHFRKKNVLTRALGTHSVVKVDVQCFPVQASDIFLLCTDGFHNALDHEEIKALLSHPDPDMQKMVDNLVQRAKSLNGSDNITAALAYIEKVSAENGKKDKINLKMTVAEEPARALNFEDKFIKEKYLQNQYGNRFGWKKSKRSWWRFFVIVGLMITALIYGLLGRKWLPESQNPEARKPVAVAASDIPASVELVEKSIPAPTPAAEPVGGYLVLLHVSGMRQLERLRNLSGVRLLDQFYSDTSSEFSREKSGRVNRPISAGSYSFALLDSLQTIVYRKNGINLHALRTADSIKTARADTVPLLPKSTVMPVQDSIANRSDSVAQSSNKDTLHVPQ
ncbi:MAG: Stp1/IreP family PP2C-type Ser/Thr phosphatase [candidate division KSB1 bacterium]|nr:Stp1/IreP family PP2C-type Ser/Thr phosphatase [candidate division KSB1 bacterium]MDZ7302703.1 Stp1/IreP family PP2C-type Ser/Thr phosphatase [candidate division KSB1 bacterium]MDZ7311766.1 Stp1/IreP family PP2C-type Ser/Thr phosphatase [candidate division KSB1 bacterium]